jgi:hypothetical protein
VLQFQARMHEINSAACPDFQRPQGGYEVTVRHTLHDEVEHYR